jgi:hypothetical protein
MKAIDLYKNININFLRLFFLSVPPHTFVDFRSYFLLLCVCVSFCGFICPCCVCVIKQNKTKQNELKERERKKKKKKKKKKKGGAGHYI